MNLGEAKLGDTLYFSVATNNVSGAPATPDLSPQFWVFDRNLATPIIAASSMQPQAWGSLYNGVVPVLTSLGFAANRYYNIAVSGIVNGNPGTATVLTFVTRNQSVDDVQPSGSTVNANVISSSFAAASGFWSLPVSLPLTSVPNSGNMTYGGLLQWIFERSHNYITTTSGLDTVYRMDGITPLGSGILSDDGSQFKRLAYS